MKFLLISPFTNASGSAIRFWNIAAALQKKSYKVVYAERLAKNVRPLHHAEGVVYYGCPSVGVLFLDIIFSTFFYFAAFLRNIDCAVFYALKPGPNNCIVALIAKIFGKKIILDVDDLDYAYLRKGAARNILNFFFDFMPHLFDLVTYHTPKLREYLIFKARVPERKLYYLAQGVTPEFIDFGSYGINTLPFAPATLIYVATLGITSDFDDLIPAIKSLFGCDPGITMNVVGDGCRRNEFEREAGEAGLGERIRFIGTVDHASLPAFIASHRIGVNYMRPSLVNQCRAVLKIREYLACGIEVVCNDVGDVELFRDYIHISSSIEEMFETISSLLSKPVRINNSGRNFIIKNFQWTDIIDGFCNKVANT